MVSPDQNTHNSLQNQELQIKTAASDSASAAHGRCTESPDGPTDPVVTGLDDADLRSVVAAWPTLPEPIRAGLLALVKAASGAGGGR